LFLFSCSEDDPKSSEKKIISYKIEAEKNGLKQDIIGEIDELTQTITLNEGVPSNKELIATFEATGKVFIGDILQVSGVTANKYDSDLEYTILADDESSTKYTLKSSPASSAGITSYALNLLINGEIEAVKGVFSEDSHTIVVQSPLYWIENLGSVVATFESEGEITVGDVVQTSGETVNNFQEEIIYVAQAEDGARTEYTVVLQSPQLSGLPIIKIETEGGIEVTDKENYLTANFMLQDRQHPEYDIEKSTGIRGRGNTSWHSPKKPYRLKFDKKTSLFGLGAAKSWVLLANYVDPIFIMNTIAFELGHRLDLEYTNHANHVELFMNGKYSGSYVLTEQVQVNEHRVNINEETGFFIELDQYYDEDFKFRSGILNLPVNIKSPELNDNAGMAFVEEAVAELENALFDPSSNFPENRRYAELIDVPSLINYLLVNEIVRNRELYHPKSVFLYKDTDQKMKMGPLWDFDWGFGYSGSGFIYFENEQDLIFYGQGLGSPTEAGRAFFNQFFKDPVFRQAYRDRWNEIKGKLSDIDQFVDGYALYLDKSAMYDQKLWNNGLDFQEQIRKTKTWLNERIEFLDSEISGD